MDFLQPSSTLDTHLGIYICSGSTLVWYVLIRFFPSTDHIDALQLRIYDYADARHEKFIGYAISFLQTRTYTDKQILVGVTEWTLR